MNYLKTNLDSIHSVINKTCQQSRRNIEDVLLLPVTKRQGIEKIQALYNIGLKEFGENRTEELAEKAKSLPRDIHWHMIGHLQSRKVLDAVTYAKTIHSVDSLKLIKKIQTVAASLGKKINIYLQVNISGEESKSGFTKDSVKNAAQTAKDSENIHCIGLMTMAPQGLSKNDLVPIFCGLRTLQNNLQNDFPEISQLSMGMSGDFVTAIEEGSTCVRVGTLLLGEREN